MGGVRHLFFAGPGRGEAAWRGGKFDEAVDLFRRFSTSRELADFLTLAAYERLVAEEEGGGRARM